MQVLFDDVDVDRLSTGFGTTSRPPTSEFSDSDAMREEFPFDLSDLERETDMVIVDMDRRDDWDDRPDSPCAAGIRDALLSTSAFASTSPGALPLTVVAAAGAEKPTEFVTLGVGEALAPVEHHRDRATSISGDGEEEAALPMACVTPSDAQALPAPRDNDDVAASGSDGALDPAPWAKDVAPSGSDRALDPAPTVEDVAASNSDWALDYVPRDTGVTTSGGDSIKEALEPAPMFDTTSGGGGLDIAPMSGTTSGWTEAESYRPVTEPVSPYRAPTPTDRPQLTLGAVYTAMATSVASGRHQQAALLMQSHDTPLTQDVVEMLVAAMRYSRTESTRAIHRQATVMQQLGLPSDIVLTQLLATLARMLQL